MQNAVRKYITNITTNSVWKRLETKCIYPWSWINVCIL